QRLMEDDCWLPGHTKPVSAPMRNARLSSSAGEATGLLLDGHERDSETGSHAWEAPLDTALELVWEKPVRIECLRMVFDSDLKNDKVRPCHYPLGAMPVVMPKSLVRSCRVEIMNVDGVWQELHREVENRRRLIVLPVGREIRAVRWIGEQTWGHPKPRVYALEACAEELPLSRGLPAGQSWPEVVAGTPRCGPAGAG